ncbi:MAG: NADH-quinone oxidoreductase subunit M [Acidobacteriota bacterium]
MPYILSILTYIPLAAALVILFIPKENTKLIKYFTTGVFLLDFLLSLPLWFGWDAAQAVADAKHSLWVFEEGPHPWITSLGAGYHFGVDGMSMLLVLLTTLLGVIAAWSSWTYIQSREKEYYIWLLILQTGMLGVFCSLDFFLFYVFWEVMLVPMYFLIGIWGGANKLYAAIKFFLYTLAGSVLMLIGILVLYFRTPVDAAGVHSFDLDVILQQVALNPALQWWVFAAFFVGFAIKVPMFPFHTWLPDAHVEAPTAGSVILAGVLLKMGTYGFYRFALPILPDATLAWLPFLLILSIIGVIYGAMVSLVQKDMKKLVAYSSVSHLGFCMAGLFALTEAGIKGSIMQMLNHGISTGGLFLLVGIIYERMHTREIKLYGGLAKLMPVYAVFFMIITLSSIGLPGLNGFIGEITILMGAYHMPEFLIFSKSLVFFLVAGMLLGAAYMLWLYQRVFFGEVTNPHLEEHVKGKDMNGREWGYMIPLVLLALWIGLYPKPVFDKMDRSVQYLMQRMKPAVERVAAAKGVPVPQVTTPAAAPETPGHAEIGSHAQEAGATHAEGSH